MNRMRFRRSGIAKMLRKLSMPATYASSSQVPPAASIFARADSLN
jgi:hypothetical protein